MMERITGSDYVSYWPYCEDGNEHVWGTYKLEQTWTSDFSGSKPPKDCPVREYQRCVVCSENRVV